MYITCGDCFVKITFQSRFILYNAWGEDTCEKCKMSPFFVCSRLIDSQLWNAFQTIWIIIMAKVWMINKIWYWSVPHQHVLPGGEVYKGIDGPRFIQASKPPCLKGCIMKYIKQAILSAPLCRPLEKTSSPLDLRASEQVLVICWRLCAPSSPCHQPSISVPWYLGDFIRSILG